MTANFTWQSAAIGGAMIGLSAALMMILTGRIAGISGILGGLLTTWGGSSWRALFLSGLVVAPLLGMMFAYFIEPPAMPSSWIVIVVAGFLVGYGTRLGGGCTSGHGVCGIAQFSPRSIVGTLVFMAVAIAVVAIQRHVIGG
jgi:uncharacterized membrane protein YedE/YeeE